MKRNKLTRFRNLVLLAAISMVAIEIFAIDRKYYYSMATIDSEMVVVVSEDPALFRVPSATRGLAGRSSSSNSKGTNEQKPLPLLVLHVGPGATGMAAIKATLAGNREFLFSEDNYTYIGNNNNNNNSNNNDDDEINNVADLSRPYHCERKIENGERRSDGGSSPEECIPVLSPSLERLLDNNNNNANMVGSSEVLANPGEHERMVWAEKTRNKWDVRVVVSYRRLHELLPETYTTELHHRKRNHGRYCHEKWPDSNGDCREIPSFLEYLEHEADLSKHEFVKPYQAWSKNFRVSVFNVHQEDGDENENENENDLSTNFVCRAMPGADNTCQRLKFRSESKTNTTITGGNNNERSSSSNNNNNPVAVFSKGGLLLEYDRLAVRAYEEGLVHEIDNRRELALAIQKHHDANNNNNNKWNAENARLMMPLACPHKDKLDELYQASLEFESWALALAEPKGNKPNVMTSDFDGSWEETLRHKKLCNLDTSEALKHEEWRAFFRLRYATKTMEHFYVR